MRTNRDQRSFSALELPAPRALMPLRKIKEEKERI
jgi:hypothetical protein